MRGFARTTWLVLLAACQGTPQVPTFAPELPITVVGDGEPGVVLSARVVPCSGEGALACRRAHDADTWRALRDRFALATLGSQHAALEQAASLDQVVFAPVPLGATVVGVVVSSDEGVDVVTLDCVDSGDVLLSPVQNGNTCCLLQIARRTCQLAIILRDEPRGVEQTLAVFAAP